MSRRPRGAGAVMADHAPEEVAEDTPELRLFRALNYFPTPLWAARAGGELIQRIDPGPWSVWEPACGQGHMAEGLAGYFAEVVASDIHPHAPLGGRAPGRVVDFLSAEAEGLGPVDWVVTNPPFRLAEAFVRVGLQRARRGVAILARLAFFETDTRYPLFFGETPLRVVAPFFERVPMHLGAWRPSGGTATAYAWFVWLKPFADPFAGELVQVIPIPPGAKARLTRPDDARRFGAPAGDAPLLEMIGGAA